MHHGCHNILNITNSSSKDWKLEQLRLWKKLMTRKTDLKENINLIMRYPSVKLYDSTHRSPMLRYITSNVEILYSQNSSQTSSTIQLASKVHHGTRTYRMKHKLRSKRLYIRFASFLKSTDKHILTTLLQTSNNYVSHSSLLQQESFNLRYELCN